MAAVVVPQSKYVSIRQRTALSSSGAGHQRDICTYSGRRESNPHDQLGRLVTHSGPSPQLTALTRRYGISTQRRRLFG